MAIAPATDKALYQKLAGDSGIVSAVGTVDGLLQVYADFVPDGATLPYVYFYCVSAPFENESPRESLDELWTVEAVASSRAGAETLENEVIEALHRTTLTDSGWQNYYTAVVGRQRQTFIEDRQKYFHRMIEIRVRWAKDEV